MVNHVHNHPDGTHECGCAHSDWYSPAGGDEFRLIVEENHGHSHRTETGALVKCYHHCRSVITSPAFWIGSTMSFPIEHALWTKIPFLHAIAVWCGL